MNYAKRIIVASSVLALVDCNNFFVSCERIFRPDLEGKPVVVLSSGDGCVVARSLEAKQLGVPMGAPAFKHRDLFEKEGVVQFSANFELYGDISRRIVGVLQSITPRIEIYSVDESFLDLSELDITDYGAWGEQVRSTVLRWVGIPVSIGIAPSKTLAKLASQCAKNDMSLSGVLDLTNPTLQENYLKQTSVSDVWGIGRKLAPQLKACGVYTAHDLANLRPQYVQQIMGITGRQLVTELQGTSCHPLASLHKPQQMISRGRTFGGDVPDINTLLAASASMASRAAHKLRQDRQVTCRIGLCIRTNRHKPGYRLWYDDIQLSTPTNDTGRICEELKKILNKFFMQQQSYHKLDIYLLDLLPDTNVQASLLEPNAVLRSTQEGHRMAAVDSINNRYGRSTIRPAAELLSNSWQPRRNLSSPRYVSSWDELPEAKSYRT